LFGPLPERRHRRGAAGPQVVAVADLATRRQHRRDDAGIDAACLHDPIPEEKPMPFAQIDMIEGRTDDQKRAVIQKVSAALVVATGATTEAIRVWIQAPSASPPGLQPVDQRNRGRMNFDGDRNAHDVHSESAPLRLSAPASSDMHSIPHLT
jgi:4-oxalocrotonate tautomerase